MLLCTMFTMYTFANYLFNKFVKRLQAPITIKRSTESQTHDSCNDSCRKRDIVGEEQEDNYWYDFLARITSLDKLDDVRLLAEASDTGCGIPIGLRPDRELLIFATACLHMMEQEHGENPVQPFNQRERAGYGIQCIVQHTHRWQVDANGVVRDPIWELYRRYIIEFRSCTIEALCHLAPRFNIITGSRPNKDLAIAAIAANAAIEYDHGHNHHSNFAVRPIIAQDPTLIQVPTAATTTVANDRWNPHVWPTGNSVRL